MKDRNQRKAKTEAIKIRSVADLHGAIEYLDTMYGLEDADLIFPDGLRLVSVSFVQGTREDGTRTSQLIVSDKWPRGMHHSNRYQGYRVVDDEG